jgi:hypothetical protein
MPTFTHHLRRCWSVLRHPSDTSNIAVSLRLIQAMLLLLLVLAVAWVLLGLRVLGMV